MKTKKLVTLSIILVLIVGLIVVVKTIENRQPDEASLLFFPSLQKQACATLTISDKSGTVRLSRKNDQWLVLSGPAAAAAQPVGGAAPLASDASIANGYPVDSASITVALEKLRTMKRIKEDLISSKPQKQATFEVDSAQGLLITATDDQAKAIGSFYIGKNSPDYSGNYVRLAGSSDVYRVGGNIKYAFFSDAKRWRNKTVLKFDESSANKLTLVKQGSVAELRKGSDSAAGWTLTLPETSKAKADQVKEITSTLSNLICGDWEEDATVISADTMGFDKPELVAKIELNGGGRKEIIVGKKKNATSRFWVRNSDLPGTTFLVDDYLISKIDKNAAQLKDSTVVAAPAPTAGTAPAASGKK